jgi:hypothetical protein
MSNSRTSGRRPGLPKQRAVGANTSEAMKWAIEQDAARVAALELQRRRALLTSLGLPNGRRSPESPTASPSTSPTAWSPAPNPTSASSTPLRTIYLPSTPEPQRPEPSHHDHPEALYADGADEALRDRVGERRQLRSVSSLRSKLFG